MPRFLLSSLLLFFAVIVAVPQASAQYSVGIKLDKNSFLSQEAMRATVQISNSSGGDVVMGGGGGNWLQFTLEDSSGRMYPPVAVDIEEPFILRSGATIQRQVLVSDTHSVSDVGSYAIKANVFHAPTGQFYESNRIRFTVTDVRPFWEKDFGVPQGQPDAGRIRRYSLHMARTDTGTKLYVRLTDEVSKLKLATYSLGPYNQSLNPTFSVDAENRLQLFFLAVPKVFAHCIIGTDGSLISRKYYREEEGSRPALANQGGQLTVVGGVLYDPNAAAVEVRNERKSSQRPPGL